MEHRSSLRSSFYRSLVSVVWLGWLSMPLEHPGVTLGGGCDPPLGSCWALLPLFSLAQRGGRASSLPRLGVSACPEDSCSCPLWSRLSTQEMRHARCPWFVLKGRKHTLILLQSPHIEISGLLAGQGAPRGWIPIGHPYGLGMGHSWSSQHLLHSWETKAQSADSLYAVLDEACPGSAPIRFLLCALY